jgi:methyltransferase (TIGR00027 family)
MKAGRSSRTAAMVCMGRAIAHAKRLLPEFDDPTAMALLPETVRGRVERFLSGAPAVGWRERVERSYLDRQARMMAVRTVAIDEAIRDAASPQLVILGAGLDGRAWRMKELAGTTVFEVDHPDTQREKRERVAALTPTAREIRFVPVDFTSDDLDAELESAGHDPARATTWVWEGVVMYLTPADVEATLKILDRRSAPGSHLIVNYQRPAWFLLLVTVIALRHMGEPLRSAFTPDEMRHLLATHGFEVTTDRHLPEIAESLSPDLAQHIRKLTHQRLAFANRAVPPHEPPPGEGVH